MRALLSLVLILGLSGLPLDVEASEARSAQSDEIRVDREYQSGLGIIYISNLTDNIFCVMIQGIPVRKMSLDGGDKVLGVYTDYLLLLPRQERRPSLYVRPNDFREQPAPDSWFDYLEVEVSTVPGMPTRPSLDDILKLSGLRHYQLRKSCRDEVNWHHKFQR